MSLSNNARWPLKSKDGKEPSEDERKTIEKLPRDLLFPCSTDLRELEMPKKRVAPREMNSFIIFRRQLALIAKQLQLSDDGKLLSRFASYIWHGASQSERQGYADIAEELKQRHYARYPDYTYERRKRKTNDNDFIVNTPATIIKTNGKRRVANNNNSNNNHNKNNNSNNNNNNNPSPIPPVSVESNNLPIQQDVYVPVMYAQAQDPVFSFTTGINDDMFQAVQNVDNSYNNLMHQYPYILTEFYVPNPTMEGPDCCDINGEDNILNNYMNFDDILPQPTLYQTLNEGDTNAGFNNNINEFLSLPIPVDEY